MNLTNEILLFNHFLIMSDFVFYCIIFILYFIVHMCECHMYLLTYYVEHSITYTTYSVVVFVY